MGNIEKNKNDHIDPKYIARIIFLIKTVKTIFT